MLLFEAHGTASSAEMKNLMSRVKTRLQPSLAKAAPAVGFRQLNKGWNADPNAPGPRLRTGGSTLYLTVVPNRFQFAGYEDFESLELSFKDCSGYRLTSVNDHAWYSGQCRFSGIAPAWGEFYEISGETRDTLESEPWIPASGTGNRHFHFYLRDGTLEVKAGDWNLRTLT
ncbi:hypothetical protein K3722_17040 [Leisingera caerulea]|uniref:Uncharacterized protein n=1 Tax=Leisingera caerulea TaxID=506591 RepID=A0ABY5WVL7_LEICA|nr:hypothetical protein [Leisingera caerulea]UWQ58169.1 hypothetical protein K3722_17040 [Leisingera caerulea]